MDKKNGLIIKLPNKLSLDSNTLTNKFNSFEIDLPANYVDNGENNLDGNGTNFSFSEPSRMILDGDGYIFYGYKGVQNLGKDVLIDVKNWKNLYNSTKSINTTERIVFGVHSNGTTPLRWHILNADKIIELRTRTIGNSSLTLKEITKCINVTIINCLHIIGNISDLSNLTSLKEIRLSNNDVNGNISALSNFTSLEKLMLSSTKVSGDISVLSNLKLLYDLRLANNNVSGNISALSSMSNMEFLSISNINLSGDISSLNGMSKLKSLVIPSSTIGKITYTDAQIKTLQDKGVTISIATDKNKLQIRE